MKIYKIFAFLFAILLFILPASAAAEGNPEFWNADWGYISYGNGSRVRISASSPFQRWGMGTIFYGHLSGDSRDDDYATPWGIYIDMQNAQAGYIYYINLDLNISARSDSYSGATSPIYQDYDYRIAEYAPAEGNNYGEYISLESYSGNAISTSFQRDSGSANRCHIEIIISTAFAPEFVGKILLISGKWAWENIGNEDRYYNDGIYQQANNAGLSMQQDRDGSYYQQALLNNIAAGNAAASEYYSDSLSKLDSIRGDIAAIPEEISDILASRDEAEKEWAMAEGDSHISSILDSASDIIPVDNIIDILDQFNDYLYYSGTSSILSFPALSIPAFGDQAAIPLSESKNFDLISAIDEYIPSEYIPFIRAFLSAALCLGIINECKNLIGWILGQSMLPEEMLLDESIHEWRSDQ